MVDRSYQISDIILDQDVDESFCCGICHDVLRLPIICGGGHSWCTDCIKSYNKTKCPICPQVIDYNKPIPNFALQSVIDKMICVCPYNIKDYEVINYNKKQKIEQSFQPVNSLLGKIFFDITCTIIGDISKDKILENECNIENIKKRNRSLKEVKSDCCDEFHCTWSGPYEQLQNHLKNCVSISLPCIYAPHGCDFNGNKSQMINHHTNVAIEHVKLLSTKIVKLTNTITATEYDNNQYKQQVITLNNNIANTRNQLLLVTNESVLDKETITVLSNNFIDIEARLTTTTASKTALTKIAQDYKKELTIANDENSKIIESLRKEIAESKNNNIIESLKNSSNNNNNEKSNINNNNENDNKNDNNNKNYNSNNNNNISSNNNNNNTNNDILRPVAIIKTLEKQIKEIIWSKKSSPSTTMTVQWTINTVRSKIKNKVIINSDEFVFISNNGSIYKLHLQAKFGKANYNNNSSNNDNNNDFGLYLHHRESIGFSNNMPIDVSGINLTLYHDDHNLNITRIFNNNKKIEGLGLGIGWRELCEDLTAITTTGEGFIDNDQVIVTVDFPMQVKKSELQLVTN